MARPGVMLYFDLVDPIKRLSYEDQGKLFQAILEYGQYGVLPEFDGVLAIAWDFIKPGLDRDAKKYSDRVLKNSHNSYCAKCKREGMEPLDFEEWKANRDQSVSSGVKRHPTTTTASTTATDSTPTTATKRTRDAIGDREGTGEEEPTCKNADMTFNDMRNAAIGSLVNYGK